MKIVKTDDYAIIKDVIQDAFRVAPWHIPSMPESEIVKRFEIFDSGQRTVLAAMCDPDKLIAWTPLSETEVVGITWFGIVKKESMSDDVMTHLESLNPNGIHVYFSAIAVRKDWQRNGIATRLQGASLSLVKDMYPGCIVYTRMRSDNVRMIRINESYGFVPGGIIEETNDGNPHAEWWFKLS